MLTRSPLAGVGFYGWVCAGAASIVLAVPDITWSQQLVRLTRGEGATILPPGRSYRLGEKMPNQKPNEITLDGDPIISICCPNPKPSSARQTSCVTERQVPLKASRAAVLGRYGRPTNSTPKEEMRYSGVTFYLDGDSVIRICIVRR